jgi:DtxR family Mn-dependent transcriptional regulator
MSESEEMYLVTIARLQETTAAERVPVAQLAAALSVQPVSANQMIRKLADGGLLDYAPYKGVNLTAQGGRLAATILRHRRLWEVFFVERLGIAPSEASSLACRMEHLIPDEAAERLASFLGNPTTSPGGSAIPAAEKVCLPPPGLPVNRLSAGERARVAQITGELPTRRFLEREGIFPGEDVTLLGVSSSGTVILQTAGGAVIQLADALAQLVLVIPPSTQPIGA